ncbi:MAG: PhoH family protein, partial [gamma proteobacterium symbiont of Bathyaustriella thionipta]|nr:PhoH family protein [gamma proteobacterium symbiont of Bathyaustriella thionipta]
MNRSEAGRLFILDTNVLMHDPTSIFRFQEHDVCLPMVVLEELDAAKKGLSEVSRNVRQVSRFLDELLSHTAGSAIEEGLPLKSTSFKGEGGQASGRLFFQTLAVAHELPVSLAGNKPDNHILSAAIALQKERPHSHITIVSKDINLRIKATALGISAEDYSTDQVLDDVNLLHTGYLQLNDDFWDRHSQKLDSWQEQGRSFYRLHGPDTADWYPGLCIYLEQDNFEAIVRSCEGQQAVIETLTDYRHSSHSVWGINALNREQNFALNLLMDPELDFVTLLGMAGSGKTLLTLAAGLAQTLDDDRFREIIMTRATVPVGEDIGFLPGTEEEKMTPWMGALMDNLEVL